MTNATQKTHPIASAGWTNLWRVGVIGGSMVFVGVTAGCVPATPSDESLASTIVITKYAPAVNFGSFGTFFLRPEIRELKDDDMNAVLDPIYANPLLAETKKQLLARGYTEAASPSTAELAVEMLYINSTWVATSCYSWWGGGYWGYPYYPYYPYYGGCSASTWQTNTVATMIVDLTAAGPPSTTDGGIDDSGVAPGLPDSAFGARILGGIWFSGIYGIAFNAADSLQKGLDGINQAFVQSPYLTTR